MIHSLDRRVSKMVVATLAEIAPASETVEYAVSFDTLAQWSETKGRYEFEPRVVIYLALDCPETKHFITSTQSIVAQEATSVEVARRVRLAWDHLVTERIERAERATDA